MKATNIEDVVILPQKGVVCIDEGHFCAPLLVELLRKADNAKSKAHVNVALLTGTSSQVGWGSSCADLFALADSIRHVTSTCATCGKPAPFTVRTDGTTDKVAIGGANMYSPRCRSHI